jgi:DNA helicase II / ATP-dependent DNA helicase PcrA
MPFNPGDLDAANAVQRAAAEATDSEIRLVAGPGTGKSNTIERRVCWLLGQHNFDPGELAVVSFTNASVIDLRVRLHAHCREHHHAKVRDVSVTTLHSLALRLLRQAGQLDQYATQPLVLNDWELENIYDAEFGDTHGITRRRRLQEIRRFYEALWSTGREDATTYTAPRPPITQAERQQFLDFHGPTAQVYSAVLPGEIVRQCVDAAEAGIIDIGALLGITTLIVDEYQDLNPVDLEFVDRISNAGVMVFVAGDDDQSIYSFRHASPAGIQQFATKYPNAGLHVLGHCFRCTPSVLTAATTLMTHNQAPDRINKALVSLYATANPPNEGVVHRWRFVNAASEAGAIAASCSALIQAGLAPREILILLANSSASGGLWPAIQTALAQAAVPHDEPKEEGFHESEVGRLTLALLRIVCSRNDAGETQDLVAHRTLLGLKTGVGVRTCNQIRQGVIATPNVTFRGLFYDGVPNGVFNGRARAALDDARAVCDIVNDWTKEDTLAQRRDEIDAIIEVTLSAEEVATWHEFIEPLPAAITLEELRDYVWVDNAQQRNDVLRAVAVRLGVDPEQVPPQLDRVRVMTMHGAKGLSGRVVFIPGLEQGFLPNQHQAPFIALRLEAARLLYVSITRARATCVLSFAQSRMVFGSTELRVASPFAAQTGGAFVGRGGGLTGSEVATIMTAINNL